MGEDGGLRKGGGGVECSGPPSVLPTTPTTVMSPSSSSPSSDRTVSLSTQRVQSLHSQNMRLIGIRMAPDDRRGDNQHADYCSRHDEYHQTSLKTLANALDKEETTSESKPCNCESGSDEHDPDPDSSMPSVPSLSRSSRHLTSVRKLQEVDCEKDEGVLGKTSEKDADQLQERGSAVFFPKTLLIHEPNEDLSEENSKDSVQEKHSFVCCMSDKHDKTVLLSSERETAYDQDENSKDYAQEKHILSPCDMSEKDEKVAVPIPVRISGTEDTKSFSDSHQEEPIGRLDNKLTEEQVKGVDCLVEQIMKMMKAHVNLLMKKASAEDTAEEGTVKLWEKMGALFEANEDNLEKTVKEVIARMYEMPKLDANLGKNSEAQPVDKPVTTTEEDSDTTSSSKMKRGAIEKKHVALQTLHNLISSNSLNNPALICLYAQYTQENSVSHVPYKHCNEFRNINVPGSSIYLGDHDSFLKLGIKMDDDSTLQNHLGSEPSDAEAAQHMGELPAWFPQSSRIPVENSYHDFQSTQFWLQRTWSKESTRSYAESLEAAKADGKSMIILDSLKHTKNQGQNDDGQMPTIEDEILKNPDAMLSEDDAVEKADLEDSEKSAPVPSEKIATGAPAEELETVPLPPPAPACHREHPRRRRSKKSEQQRSSRKKQRKGSVDCPAVVIVPADQASKSSEPPAPETAVTGMNNPDADDDDFSMNNPSCKGLAVMGPAMDDAETDRHEGKVTEEKEKAEKGVQSAVASTRDADDAPDTADACKKGSVHTADNRNAHSSHSQQQAGTTEAEVMYGCHDHEPASGKNAAAAAASFPQVASDREPSTQHKACPSAVVPMSVCPPQTNREMTCYRRKHQASKSHERREEKVCMERHMKTGQPRLVMNRRGHLEAPSDFEWGGERVDLHSVAVVFRTASGTCGGGNAGSGQQCGSSFSGRQSGSQGWGGARPKNGGSGGSRDDGDDDGDDKRERRPTKHAADEPEGPPPIDAKRKGQATPPARNYKRHRKKQHGTITNEQMCHCLGQAGLGIQMLQQSSGAGELDRCVMLCLHDTGNVMSPQDDDLLCCSCAMLHTLLSHFASAAHDSSCHLCLQLFTLVHFHMLRCRANGRGTEDQDVSVNVCHKMLMAGLFEDTSAAALSGKVWVKVRKYLSAALGPILLVESHVGEVEDTETQEWEEEEQGEEKVEEMFNNYSSYHTSNVSDSVMNGIGSDILKDIQRPESLPLPSPTFTSFASTSGETMPAFEMPSPSTAATHSPSTAGFGSLTSAAMPAAATHTTNTPATTSAASSAHTTTTAGAKPHTSSSAVMPGKSPLTRRPSARGSPATNIKPIPEEPSSLPPSSLPLLQQETTIGATPINSPSASSSSEDVYKFIYNFPLPEDKRPAQGRLPHYPDDRYETQKTYGVRDGAILSMPEPRVRPLKYDEPLLSVEMKPQGVPGIGEVVYGTRQLLLTVAKTWQQERDECRASRRCRYQHHEEGVILAPFKKQLRILHTRYQKHHQWERLVHLGNGVTGKCHLCIDRTSNFKFCCKKMHILSYEDQELDIWSELSHPNVVCFFGAIRHGEKIYMLAEFIDGGSLAALIKEQWLIGRRLSHWMALNYFRQILETLTYLQSKGILHEDIKADNLLLRQGTTEIILADFGVAQRICHDHAPRGKSPTGAPAHWSPEKASSEGHGFPSDLWAAACVLIHMLSGNPPWVSRFPDAGMLNFIIWSRPAPVDDIPENVKESMRDLITCCLVKDSAIRPTAKQILQHPAFQLLNQSGTIFSTVLPMLPDQLPEATVSGTQHVTSHIREEGAVGGKTTISDVSAVYDCSVVSTRTSGRQAQDVPQCSAYVHASSQSTASQAVSSQIVHKSDDIRQRKASLQIQSQQKMSTRIGHPHLSAYNTRFASGPASLPAMARATPHTSELRESARRQSSGSAPASLEEHPAEAPAQSSSGASLHLPPASSSHSSMTVVTTATVAAEETYTQYMGNAYSSRTTTHINTTVRHITTTPPDPLASEADRERDFSQGVSLQQESESLGAYGGSSSMSSLPTEKFATMAPSMPTPRRRVIPVASQDSIATSTSGAFSAAGKSPTSSVASLKWPEVSSRVETSTRKPPPQGPWSLDISLQQQVSGDPDPRSRWRHKSQEEHAASILPTPVDAQPGASQQQDDEVCAAKETTLSVHQAGPDNIPSVTRVSLQKSAGPRSMISVPPPTGIAEETEVSTSLACRQSAGDITNSALSASTQRESVDQTDNRNNNTSKDNTSAAAEHMSPSAALGLSSFQSAPEELDYHHYPDLSLEDFQVIAKRTGLSMIPEDKEGESSGNSLLGSSVGSDDIHAWQYYQDQLGGESEEEVISLAHLLPGQGRPELQLYNPDPTLTSPTGRGQGPAPTSLPKLEELLATSIPDSAGTLRSAKNTSSSEEVTFSSGQARMLLDPTKTVDEKKLQATIPSSQIGLDFPDVPSTPEQGPKSVAFSAAVSDDDHISSGDLFGSGSERNAEFLAAEERRRRAISGDSSGSELAALEQLSPLSGSSGSVSPCFSRRNHNLRLDVSKTSAHFTSTPQRSKSETRTSDPKSGDALRPSIPSNPSGQPDSGYGTHTHPPDVRSGVGGGFVWRKKSDVVPVEASPITPAPLSAGSRSRSSRPGSGSSTPHSNSTYDKQEEELSNLIQTINFSGLDIEPEEPVDMTSSDHSSLSHHASLMMEPLGETDAPDEEVTSMLSVLQDGIPEQLEGHRLEFYNHEGKQLFDMRVRPRSNSWKELVRSFRSKIRKEGYRHFTLMHSDSETPVNWSAPIEPSLTKVKVIEVSNESFDCWCEDHLIHC